MASIEITIHRLVHRPVPGRWGAPWVYEATFADGGRVGPDGTYWYGDHSSVELIERLQRKYGKANVTIIKTWPPRKPRNSK